MRAIVTFPVVIIGPMRDGSMRVHAEGCRDIAKDSASCGDQYPLTVQVSTKREVADAVYGPQAGSFYSEAGGDEANGSLANYLDNYAADRGVFDFAPCIHDLPVKPADDAPVRPRIVKRVTGLLNHEPGLRTYRMRVDLVIGQELTKVQVEKVRSLVQQAANTMVGADEVLDGEPLKAEFFFTRR